MRTNDLRQALETAAFDILSRVVAHPLSYLLRRDFLQTFDYSPLHERRKPLSPEEANQTITDAISKSKEFLVSRFGSTELRVVYKSVLRKSRSPGEKLFGMISRFEAPVWTHWEHKNLATQSGFFPISEEAIACFVETYLESAEQIDLLASWAQGETVVSDHVSAAQVTTLDGIEPFFVERPWTDALEGKSVLVVHPFTESIEDQYRNRAEWGSDQFSLPKFDLQTVQAVQSLGGTSDRFSSWFEALDSMEKLCLRYNPDAVIIGAGAYGMPLAARLKPKFQVPIIHLAGATQLLFGIRGKRWDFRVKYQQLFNPSWVRPNGGERPPGFRGVDGGVYW